jgi:hypothetical protein
MTNGKPGTRVDIWNVGEFTTTSGRTRRFVE